MYFVKLYKKEIVTKILTNKLLLKKFTYNMNIFKKFKENYLTLDFKNFKAYRQALQIKLNIFKINYNLLFLLLYKFIFRGNLLEFLFGNPKKIQYLLTYNLKFAGMKKKKGVLFLIRNTKGQLIKFLKVQGTIKNKQNQLSILLALSKIVLTLPLLVKNSATTLYFKHFTYNASKFILSFFKKVFTIKVTIQHSIKPYNGCRPKKEKRKKLKQRNG